MDNLDLRVDGRYLLLRKLGQGGFGMVYEGVNVDTRERVAVKLEHISRDPSLVQAEADNYKLLSRGVGIPRVYWFGQECEYHAMVFELLGPSLEDLFNYCGRRFSLKTVLMLADQLISRLDYIHKKGLIHRDIKPDNFLMGLGRRGNQVYITDLGLSIGEHAATARKSHRLVGTRRYASINGHVGAEQSQRDDLESLGYVLVYLLSGCLPWQRMKAATSKEKDQLILEMKRSLSIKELCLGLDEEFESYFNYVRSMEFNCEPEYARLRKSFRKLFVRKGFEFDNIFDWTVLKFQEQLSD